MFILSSVWIGIVEEDTLCHYISWPHSSEIITGLGAQALSLDVGGWLESSKRGCVALNPLHYPKNIERQGAHVTVKGRDK